MNSFRRTIKQWRESVSSFFPQARKVRAKRTKPKAEKGAFLLGPIDGDHHVVSAFTKSEARAILKRMLNIDRLPVGVGRDIGY